VRTAISTKTTAQAASFATRRTRARRRLWLVGVILLGAVGFLLYKGLTSGIEYFKTVPQALEDRSSLKGATFQLEGVVAPGTLHRLGPSHLRFRLCAPGGLTIPVEDSGTPPQLFSTDTAVVLVGHFVGDSDRFASSTILVKHSNAYVAAHPGRVRTGDGQRC
jgi:cytochrome c-type biogenesis protein CcmE